MRDAMPETAAFVDAMRDAFGAELVDEAIRAGMRGAPRFVAVEAGRTVGTVETFGADDRTHVITEEQFQDMKGPRT